MLAVTELRRVRVAVDGTPRWGRRDGDEIVLDGGGAVPEAEVSYLAPVEPSKIIAVHLTYRSRIDEYAAKTPPAPSYLMKPPSALNGHRAAPRRLRRRSPPPRPRPTAPAPSPPARTAPGSATTRASSRS